MTQKTINDLDSQGTLAATDSLEVQSVGATSTKRIAAALVKNVVNVKVDHGATGDGTTDDTTAITAAITAAEAAGKPLFFPAGTYKVAGSGSTIFTIRQPLTVYGDGYDSQILVATGVPATRDVFLYDPADSTATTFPLFRDFRIQGQSAGVGRYGIHFKPTGTNIFIRRYGVERMWFQNLGSFAVYADGSTAGTLGIFGGWLRDLWVGGDGFGATDLWDSTLIENCYLSGTGYALDLDFTSGGPGKLIVRGCNVTASKGVRIGGPIAGLLLEGNYFECLQTYGGANNAYVDLNGASGAVIQGPVVRDNIFTVLVSFGDPDGLRLNYCDDALIDGNWFNIVPTGSDAVAITANANRAHVTPSNAYPSNGGRVVNSGAMSSGGSKVLYCARTDSAAVANTTVQTAYGAPYSYTIKANTLRVGQMIETRLAVRYSATGTPTFTNRIMFNGVGGQVGAAYGFTAGAATDLLVSLSGRFIVKAVGASGTISRASDAQNSSLTTDLTVNTTVDLTLDATGQWGAADPANTAKAYQFLVLLHDAVATA